MSTGPTRVLGSGRGLWLLIGSAVVAIALVGAYVAAGGLDYKPSGEPDPCEQRAWAETDGIESVAEQFTLSALNGAACDLGVGRAELTRALVTEESRHAFAERHDISDSELEDAVRAGLMRGIDDGEAAGEISPLVATGLRLVARNIPVNDAIGLLQDAQPLLEDGGGILDTGEGLFDGQGNVLEEGQDLLQQLDQALNP